MKAIDYIIVGQGIAGSLLSYLLLKKGKKIVVLNRTRKNSSSLVAAGLFNPITGRKMVKSWMVDDLFPFMDSFYRSFEDELKVKFYHSGEIYTPFYSIEEQNDWMGKTSSPEYSTHIENLYNYSLYKDLLINPYGGIGLKGGYVDVKLMLKSFKEYLCSLDLYIEDDLDENKLIVAADHVEYKGIKAGKIIFCTGVYSSQSRYFNWLPFWPVKGEVLTIAANYKLEKIINRGIFIIPTKDKLLKVGSTYSWNDLTDDATDAARDELQEKLKKLILPDFEVEAQIAGIRPTVKDRRPIIGFHPHHKPLGIFNGLGTKGVSIAPFFAAKFADVLVEKTPEKDIAKDVNISRFFSLY